MCPVCTESFIDSKGLKRHREIHHPTALAADPAWARAEAEDEDEELIEPGHEEQYIPETVIRELGSDDGLEEGEVKSLRVDEDDDDLASMEGNLEIAEVSADSGINSSMDTSVNNQSL